MKQVGMGILLYIILVTLPIRNAMESLMIVHMLVQLPLLILVGWLVSKRQVKRLRSFFEKVNANGVPGIILVLSLSIYWMLPRSLDEALTFTHVEFLKFISLPIVGVLLKDSWYKLRGFGKTFIFLDYLSMFGLLSWLYIDTPIQICNNYLLSQQQVLGWGLLFIVLIMILYMLQFVFTDHSNSS
ncbi:hypothetical protein [Oceanobacillus senegalensis]|uniref:hypothetical protein n=1 Tax=Oceanobacillus senegalensis TaxID=1936063 RepID=UPI000A307445|nr:hypothetical protein [Oceanobacillus senegalensis]